MSHCQLFSVPDRVGTLLTNLWDMNRSTHASISLSYIGVLYWVCSKETYALVYEVDLYESRVDRQIGATAVLYCDGILKRKRRMRIGSAKHHTVFEGEGIGLILGLELIREEEVVEGMVSIGINNVVAVSATHTIKLCQSYYIWDIFHQGVEMVHNKHKGMDLLVKWTLGHVRIRGNKTADNEVKKTVRVGLSPRDKLPAPLRKELPRSKFAAGQEYLWKLNIAVWDIWKSSPRHDKMAQLDLELKYSSFTKLIKKLPCEQASLLFQLIVGHVSLKVHLHKIQKMDSPICLNCWQYSVTVRQSYITSCTNQALENC